MEINYLFICILAFLFICAVHGYKKGFLRIVISLVGIVVIIMVVTVISPVISKIIMEKTPVYNNVREKIVEVFKENNSVRDNTDLENQIETIESYDLPELLTGALIENNKEEIYNALAVTVFEDYISSYLSKMIVNAGSFIALVAILWMALWFLLFTADIINKIPVLKTFNRLMGMGSALLVGVIMVWLFYFVVLTFFGGEISSAMIASIKQSHLLTFLFNTNQLFKYIK